jgi:glycosyltransferase involved in cell wall biosynthesis
MMILLNVMLGRGRGGLERAASHYQRALAARGYNVVTVGHPEGWMRAQLPPGAPFVPTSPLNDYDFRTHFDLLRVLRDQGPAALLAHGNRAIRYASRLRGVHRFGVLHNPRFKAATHRLDACIAVTPELAAAARQRYAGMKIEVVPNLVDTASDAARPPRRDPLVIGALGRFHADKGFDILIRALADPRLRKKAWRLVIAGEGAEQENLCMLAARLGVAGRVDFVGWVDDRASFFRSVDFLCMSSRTESFGMALVEALAHGVPAIVSDNPGSREIVRRDRDALVVPAGDEMRLVAAIARLIEDEAFALALGRSGRERALSTYAFPIVAERLDETLRSLIPSTIYEDDVAARASRWAPLAISEAAQSPGPKPQLS